jgi:hypothetical protein
MRIRINSHVLLNVLNAFHSATAIQLQGIENSINGELKPLMVLSPHLGKHFQVKCLIEQLGSTGHIDGQRFAEVIEDLRKMNNSHLQPIYTKHPMNLDGDLNNDLVIEIVEPNDTFIILTLGLVTTTISFLNPEAKSASLDESSTWIAPSLGSMTPNIGSMFPAKIPGE